MTRRRWPVLATGLVATAANTVLPVDARQGVRFVTALGFIIIASIRLKRTPRMVRQPWILLIAAAAAGITGAIIAGTNYHFPSVADILIFGSYLVFVAACVSFYRHRRHDPDLDGLLDSLLVGAATAVVIFAAILSQYVRDGSVPGTERAGNALYSITTIAIVAATARLATAPGARNMAWKLLALAVASIVVNDLAVLVGTTGLDWGLTLASIIGPLPYVFGAAAVIEPSAPRLTDAPPPSPPRLTTGRLMMIGSALMILPVVLISTTLQGTRPDLPVLIIGSIVLGVLSLWRLARLFRAQQSAMDRERILREASVGLLAAPERPGIIGATLRSAGEIVWRRNPRAQIEILSEDESGWVVAASRRGDEVNPARAGAVVPVDLIEALVARPQTALSGSSVIDAPTATWRRPALTVTAVDGEAGTRAAILVGSDTDLGNSTRRALLALAGQVALAVRSADLAARLERQRVERRFRALIETSSDIVLIVDGNGCLEFVSPAITKVLGHDDIGLIGHRLTDMVHEDDLRIVERLLGDLRDDHGGRPVEVRLLDRNKVVHWFEFLFHDIHDVPEITGTVLNAREITDRKTAEQRLARSEARFRALVQHASDLVAIVDERGVIIYVSPSVTTILGYRADSLIGRHALELVSDETAAMYASELGHVQERFTRFDVEVQVVGASGVTHYLDVSCSDLRDDPAVNGIVLNCRDVTANRSLEADLERHAQYDALTGLPNRAKFTSMVNQALASEHRGARALLLIDIDDFKTINDSLGHAAGDTMLGTIADRLRTRLRLSDTAARLSADEFAVFIPDAITEDEVLQIASRLLAAVNDPIVLGDRPLDMTASIGIAFDNGSCTADDLLRNADAAMHLAKERGKARVERFATWMHENAEKRLELRTDLRRGIERDELRVYYQPIISFSTDQITGVEALVRWEHPSRGLLGPGAFIPFAEESGLIVPLGRRVFEESIKQLVAWNTRLDPDKQLSLSVNISARQLDEPSSVDELIAAADRSGVDASLITFELTESLFVATNGERVQQLERLWRHGFNLAVDDFGTGYSSFSYLEQLPVKVIKIDRSFVAGIDKSASKAAVFGRIVQLATDLGCRTVAEGIEEDGEREVVKELGCEYGQGYFFSQPVNAATLANLIGVTTATSGRRVAS